MHSTVWTLIGLLALGNLSAAAPRAEIPGGFNPEDHAGAREIVVKHKDKDDCTYILRNVLDRSCESSPIGKYKGGECVSE